MKVPTIICTSLVGFFLFQLGSACGPGNTPSNKTFTGTKNTTSFGQQEVSNDLLWTLAISGALRGLQYCQNVFKNDQWNCPTEEYRKLPIFDNKTFPNVTPETAFIYAISAAGITHEITYHCRQRTIPGCRCAEVKESEPGGSGDWHGQWGPCSDNIRFGQKETKRFLNKLEYRKGASSAVNRHNSEVGREVVRASLQKKCDWLHDNCWKVLAPFEVVASTLKQKYHNAVRVWFVDNRLEERVDNHFRNVTVSIHEQKLVYLDPSSYYVAENRTKGPP